MKQISIIITCYNEEESIPIFYEETTKILSSINYEYELLFINDGSKDKTLSRLKKISIK